MQNGIDFDPEKDVVNRRKHHISLARAAELAVEYVEEDERFAYPETRYRAWGLIDGVPYCLRYTFRQGDLRPISLRRAHLKEYRRHVR